MVLLDANAFQPSLTPEIALSIVQKSLASKRQPKFDVEQIKLVYTPFYSFSFDVVTEGGAAPTGKAALNAFTGELSDFVPLLFDRPLVKTKTVNEKEAEVEESAISASEVRETAAAKLAAQTGVKKDAITISAVSKIYVPFYRIWINVADDTYRVDVDGALGAPFGLDAIPERAKTLGEVTSATVEKMKTPSGLIELSGKAVGAVTGEGGKDGGFLNSSQGRAALLIVGILVLLFLLLRPPAVDVKCTPDASYFETSTSFLVFQQERLVPRLVRTVNGTFNELKGTCSFKSDTGKEALATARVYLKIDGQEMSRFGNSTAPPVRFTESNKGVSIPRDWSITWPDDGQEHEYAVVTQPFAS